MSGLDGSALNDHANSEDDNVEHDGVLSREGFGDEARVETSEPCSQFEDGSHPSLFGLIVDPVSHVLDSSV